MVRRHPRYDPTVWVLISDDIGIAAQPLISKDIERAKLEALGFLEARLRMMARQVEQVLQVAASIKDGKKGAAKRHKKVPAPK